MVRLLLAGELFEVGEQVVRLSGAPVPPTLERHARYLASLVERGTHETNAEGVLVELPPDRWP